MSELNRLRCQLRAVNMEYSALVRRRNAEVIHARMAGLRSERYVLMALIAVERQAGARNVRSSIATLGRLRSALHRKVGSYRSAYPLLVALFSKTAEFEQPAAVGPLRRVRRQIQHPTPARKHSR
jgi:hypothetical protein